MHAVYLLTEYRTANNLVPGCSNQAFELLSINRETVTDRMDAKKQ